MWCTLWVLLAIIGLVAPAQAQPAADEYRSEIAAKQRAIAAVDQRCQQDREALSEQELLARNELNKAVIFCGTDTGCKDKASHTYEDRMKQLRAQASDIDTNCQIQRQRIESRPLSDFAGGGAAGSAGGGNAAAGSAAPQPAGTAPPLSEPSGGEPGTAAPHH